MKDMKAIQKIIAKESMKSYLQSNPKKSDGTPKYKKHHPYTLSDECLEAQEVCNKYRRDEISEEEYKGGCMRFNLTHTYSEDIEKEVSKQRLFN